MFVEIRHGGPCSFCVSQRPCFVALTTVKAMAKKGTSIAYSRSKWPLRSMANELHNKNLFQKFKEHVHFKAPARRGKKKNIYMIRVVTRIALWVCVTVPIIDKW